MKFIALFFFFSFLFAEEENVRIDCKQISSEENHLVLEGDVQMAHSLGTLYAPKAILYELTFEKNQPLAQIEWKEGVRLELHNGSAIVSDSALFDYSANQIRFLSADPSTYFFSKTKKGQQIQLQCKTIRLQLQEDCNWNDLSKDAVDFLLAEEKITVTFEDFKAEGNHVHFDPRLQLLTLFPKEKTCHLTHNDDSLDAKFVQWDFNENQFFLKKPKGVIHSPLFKRDHPIDFSSNELTWNLTEEKIFFRGNVLMQQSPIGKLASQEVEMQRIDDYLLWARGKTTLTFSEERSLQYFGTIELDATSGRILADSPIDVRAEPLIFQDPNIVLFADKGCLYFSQQNNIFHAEKVELEGIVRFISSRIHNTTSYGIADLVSYLPEKRKLILASLSNNKVLYWQEDESLHISANEVHILQDAETRNETVEGIGNIRFSFSLEEQKFFEEIFSNPFRSHGTENSGSEESS